MLSDALTFPTRDDDWIKTVAIGGIMYILSFLVVPAFIALGYMYRVLQVADDEVPEPPVFDEWGEMIVDGLKVVAVQIAYQIVPMVVMMIAFAAGAAAFISGEGSAGGVAMLLFLFSMLLYLVAAYLMPAGLANMAQQDSIGAAFDLQTIRTAATSGTYAVAVISAIVVGGILATIAAMLSIILVGIFALFYVNVAVFYLYGRGFSKATAESGGQASGAAAGVSG